MLVSREWVLEKEGEAVESSDVEEKKDLEPINECKYDSKVADVPDALLNISTDSNVSSSEIGSSTRVIEKVPDSYVERLETQGQGGNALIDMAIISEEHALIDTGFNKRNIDVDIQDVFSANETLNEVCEPNQNEVAESLALDKASGQRSFMLGARELAIECRSYPVNWTCLSWLHSRFSEVADLERVPWFDITGKIEARLLSPQTTYVVYLVFRLRSRLCTLGLIPPKAKASVRFFDGERGDGGGDGDRHGHGIEIINIVSLGIQPSHLDGQFARYREDKWMEIELGEFFNGQGDTGEIEMRLTAVEGGHWSYDIFVEGIELRPKKLELPVVETMQWLSYFT
ncbi:hypothetical protein Vadar_013675 [Vaccinium darrowii]|uniref:Uncharacterized protein n=1 Tax=Vaccinium darrowii TaxID=229202 RepID=A0ACB7ZJD0_9ERIC|nr:hypothetical protein Vadar_013675 [Vaccinium darrowii]